MLQVLVILSLWPAILKSQDVDQGLDRLLVRFGIFNKMPMTEHDAAKAGWSKDGSCNDEKKVYVGNRYINSKYKSTRLIFGNDGILAGIQATFSPTSTYPTSSSLSIIVNENEAIVTAYFRNPHTICTKPSVDRGKSESFFGKELYIQTKSWSTKGENTIKIPKDESELNKIYPAWVKGKCYPYMGLHYWYDVSENLECKDIFPMFLLYDTKKQLKSFGWSLPVNVSGQLWEHPPAGVFQYFFSSNDMPKCLKKQVISTQHIYLTDPKKLDCKT